jgi:hypothetical protein
MRRRLGPDALRAWLAMAPKVLWLCICLDAARARVHWMLRVHGSIGSFGSRNLNILVHEGPGPQATQRSIDWGPHGTQGQGDATQPSIRVACHAPAKPAAPPRPAPRSGRSRHACGARAPRQQAARPARRGSRRVTRIDWGPSGGHMEYRRAAGGSPALIGGHMEYKVKRGGQPAPARRARPAGAWRRLPGRPLRSSIPLWPEGRPASVWPAREAGGQAGPGSELCVEAA